MPVVVTFIADVYLLLTYLERASPRRRVVGGSVVGRAAARDKSRRAFAGRERASAAALVVE